MQPSEMMKIFSPSAWWKRGGESRSSDRLNATPAFLQALSDEGISILLTSRQDSVLASVCASAGACRFARARMPASMGLAIRDSSLVVGTGNGVRVYVDVDVSSAEESSYFPISTHITGPVSIHDIGWGDDGRLWFVNTLFSALCTTDTHSQFKIEWRPPFVTQIGPYDACHLSGMAMADGSPRFVTALAATSGRGGWRNHVPDSGVLLDVQADVVCDGLSLPHSPKLFDGRVWLLEAGRGRIVSIAPLDGGKETVAEISGVLRGLDFHGRHAFVGLSRVRPSSRQTAESLAKRFGNDAICRIYAVEVATGRVVGHVEVPAIDEISSLMVVPTRRISFLEPDQKQFSETFVCRVPGGHGAPRSVSSRTA